MDSVKFEILESSKLPRFDIKSSESFLNRLFSSCFYWFLSKLFCFFIVSLCFISLSTGTKLWWLIIMWKFVIFP